MLSIFFLFLVVSGLIWFWAQQNVKKTEMKMMEAFKSLSFDITQKTNENFFNLAKTYFEKHDIGAQKELDERQKSIESALNPIRESLRQLSDHNREIEKQRSSAYGSLCKQVESLAQSENLLRNETYNLVKALKSPSIRGAWGQIHLRRVIELSGLLNHCDFFEQKTALNEEKAYRPDLVVKLPGGRQIIIDAKTPIDAYLESTESPDENIKNEKLKVHAKNLKAHIKELSNKEYWKHFSPTPEYVVLFLPAEAFFSSALQEDPTILEMGARENIIIATPTTLIAILRAIAYTWKQEILSRNTEEIIKLGKDLYERLNTMNGHWQKLGKNLSGSVEAFNQAIASYEARVLVSARKFNEMGLAKEDENLLEQITKTTKLIKDSADL